MDVPVRACSSRPGSNKEISGHRLPGLAHGGRPDDRAAAADRRQPDRHLQRPGQQRAVRDHHRHQRRPTPTPRRRSIATATSSSPSSTTVAAQPSSTAAQVAAVAVLRRRPEHRRTGLRPQPDHQRQLCSLEHQLPCQDRACSAGGTVHQRLRHGRRPARQRHPLPVLVPRPGRPVHQLRPGQRRRPDLRAAPGQQRGPIAPNILLPGNAYGNVDSQWPVTEIANLVVNPVNRQRPARQLDTGNVFEITNQGETWFDIGTPATFGSPANTSFALAFGAPTPMPPRASATWATSSMSAPRRPLRHKGQVFVSHNAGGSWTNISAGPRRLPRPADHHRSRPGQPRRLRRHHHRRLLPARTRSCWPRTPPAPVRVVKHHRQPQDHWPIRIFGQSYNPSNDPNSHALRPGHGPQLDRGQLELHDPQ